MAARFITISIDIMHDKNLNQSQKFLLAEIEQLTQLNLGCIATNEHFARLIGISKENVSKNLNSLKNKGYIDVKIIDGSRNHQRKITLIKIVTPPYQNSNPPLSNQQETKGNIPFNKTSNNKKGCFSDIQIDEIYSIYPKKRGKHEGYVKLKKIEYSDVLKNHMIKQIEQCKKETKDAQYHRGFSAWVNQRGWEDMEEINTITPTISNEDLEKMYAQN